jgi:hypothetical protein
MGRVFRRTPLGTLWRRAHKGISRASATAAEAHLAAHSRGRRGHEPISLASGAQGSARDSLKHLPAVTLRGFNDPLSTPLWMIAICAMQTVWLSIQPSVARRLQLRRLIWFEPVYAVLRRFKILLLRRFRRPDERARPLMNHGEFF